MNAFWILGAFAISALGVLAWRRASASARATPARDEAFSPGAGERSPSMPGDRGAGRLRVLQERMRFSEASFQRDCGFLLQRVAAWCQSHPGPDFSRRLDLASHTAMHRLGVLLPPGAIAEDIEPRSYRWTLGCVVAALLFDLRISGSNVGERESVRKHLQPWLHPESLAWMLADVDLTEALRIYFTHAEGGTILHDLVRRAQASTTGRALPGGNTKPAQTAVQKVKARNASSPPRPQARGHVDTAATGSLSPAVPTTPALRADPRVPPDHPASESRETPSNPDDTAGLPASIAQPATAASFLAWIRQGLADGTILTNTADAQVHFISDGMVLTVPGVFHTFASLHGGAADTSATARELQAQVCSLAWHQRAPNNAHLHRFQHRVGATGASTILKGLLFSNPEKLMPGVVPPARSANLSRLM